VAVKAQAAQSQIKEAVTVGIKRIVERRLVAHAAVDRDQRDAIVLGADQRGDLVGVAAIVVVNGQAVGLADPRLAHDRPQFRQVEPPRDQAERIRVVSNRPAAHIHPRLWHEDDLAEAPWKMTAFIASPFRRAGARRDRQNT